MKLPPSEKRRLEEKKAKFKEDKASKKSKTQQKRKEEQLLKELKEESAKKKQKPEEEEAVPIADLEEDEDAEVQALLAEVGKPPEQASGSAGSAHQDSKSKAYSSKYHGGSSKDWSSKWQGSWGKRSHWGHDQWESHYGSDRSSQRPKSPEGSPPQRDVEERPKIDFSHRRVQGPLKIARGRMGPASSDEEIPEEATELTGLEPTDDEMRADVSEKDQRGELNSLAPPNMLQPRRDGPEGPNWIRVDFIVDSGASDNTLPYETSTRFYGFLLGRRSHYPKSGTKDRQDGISVWAGFGWHIFRGGQCKATTQCGQDDKLGTHCENDTRRRPDHPEERKDNQDLLQEWRLENPNLDLVSRWWERG